MAKTTLLVKEITPRCLTEQSASLLYQNVLKALRDGSAVEVDFDGITMFASLFFNVSLAQLFSEFDAEFIGSHLSVSNLNETGQKAFTRSMQNAAEFFKLEDADKKMVSQIVDAAGGKHGD